jgi:hypothetical protein
MDATGASGSRRHTGPTRSGIKISTKATFITMKRKPNRVTIFGASHNGSNSTNAFHYEWPAKSAACTGQFLCIGPATVRNALGYI